MAIFNSELLNYQRVSIVGYKGYHRNIMGTTTLKFFFFFFLTTRIECLKPSYKN